MLCVIYVDDFKMAGPKQNLKKMWTKMSLTLDLEPPVPLDGNVYLGCGQQDISVPLVALNLQLSV